MPRETNRTLVVYTIVERRSDGQRLWIRIGHASRNRDGSLDATLDAIPTNGSLHIRELRFVPIERDQREPEIELPSAS